MAIGAITEHGRAAGSLSKRRFANVTKRWPLSGANEGNITPGDGVEFDAGMFGYRDTNGVLQLATGGDAEQPLFILDDFDSYDVVEAGKVPYMPRPNYTVETSALETGVTMGDVPPSTIMVVDPSNPGLLKVKAAETSVPWIVEEARMETIPSSTTPILVVRITPVT